jgi:hypothetical protein
MDAPKTDKPPEGGLSEQLQVAFLANDQRNLDWGTVFNSPSNEAR